RDESREPPGDGRIGERAKRGPGTQSVGIQAVRRSTHDRGCRTRRSRRAERRRRGAADEQDVKQNGSSWRRRGGIAVLVLAGLMAGWRPAGRGPVPTGAATDHVIVISIDGLRPDAIERFGAERLQRLMREGAWSLEA